MTYFLSIQRHQPIRYLVQVTHSLIHIIILLPMRKINPRALLLLPCLAKKRLVIQQAQFFNDIIHDKIRINLRLRDHDFFGRFTKLYDLINFESLIGVDFQHGEYHLS